MQGRFLGKSAGAADVFEANSRSGEVRGQGGVGGLGGGGGCRAAAGTCPAAGWDVSSPQSGCACACAWMCSWMRLDVLVHPMCLRVRQTCARARLLMMT